MCRRRSVAGAYGAPELMAPPTPMTSQQPVVSLQSMALPEPMGPPEPMGSPQPEVCRKPIVSEPRAWRANDAQGRRIMGSARPHTLQVRAVDAAHGFARNRAATRACGVLDRRKQWGRRSPRDANVPAAGAHRAAAIHKVAGRPAEPMGVLMRTGPLEVRCDCLGERVRADARTTPALWAGWGRLP